MTDAPVSDLEAVTALLGRRPAGPFEVVVRDGSGGPVVIRNAPFLDDGTPMPTRYWLVGPRQREMVGRLESTGGVNQAEADLGLEVIAEAHRRYAAERECWIEPGHVGPRPTGGVGGTRVGVKCLHAHYAWYLAGGDDPVGRWVAQHLEEREPMTDAEMRGVVKDDDAPRATAGSESRRGTRGGATEGPDES